MESILENPRFAEAYQRMEGVKLNPRRHTAANGHAHSEAVAAHAVALARANSLNEHETQLLENLGRAHDIGKIGGTAKPEKSLVVLGECGVTDPTFLGLVKWHDTNLPWYLSSQRGQPPTDKAWRKLVSEVDVRLLALFMVADRVDAPPGWRKNAPIVWFLGEARARGLVPDLVLDVPHHPSEISAGGALVSDGALLLIRVRAEGYELPKGGIEWDELPADAATRETVEEAGVETPLHAGPELAHVDYPKDGHTKRVRYFALAADGPVALGPLPDRTRERKWLRPDEVATVPLISEALRPILHSALA